MYLIFVHLSLQPGRNNDGENRPKIFNLRRWLPGALFADITERYEVSILVYTQINSQIERRYQDKNAIGMLYRMVIWLVPIWKYT